MSRYFPEPCERSSVNIKIKLHLFNYIPKGDLKRATSTLISKKYLASLRTKVDN